MDSVEKLKPCPICNSSASTLLEYKVRHENDAILVKCHKCSFMFVHNPHWLAASFRETLQPLDIGAVERCSIVLDFAQAVITTLGVSRPKVIDWGGGYGLLTRMARDRGLNFANFDPYVTPLFSAPANLKRMCKADLIVVSEVFLHMEQPVEVLNELLTFAHTVIVTAVVPPNLLSSDWWYLMPATGQHVAFYPLPTLEKLAEMTKTVLTSDKRFFHVFSKRQLSVRAKILIRFRPFAFGLAYLLRGRYLFLQAIGRSNSLTPSDQLIMEQKSSLKDWNGQPNESN
jgi:hypothetical protein